MEISEETLHRERSIGKCGPGILKLLFENIRLFFYLTMLKIIMITNEKILYEDKRITIFYWLKKITI